MNQIPIKLGLILASITTALTLLVVPCHAEPSKLATERTVLLKQNAKTFELRLWPNLANVDKPFYSLTLTATPVPDEDRSNPFARRFQVLHSQVERIADVLAEKGFLDRTKQYDPRAKTKRACKEGYILQVQANDSMMFEEQLGWDLSMLHKLDTLRDALDCDAWSIMGLLIDRMSGLRKQWEAEAAVKISRKQAEAKGLEAPRELLQDKPSDRDRLKQSDPATLVAHPQRPSWSVPFMADNGLTGLSITAMVDAQTGETTARVTQFGR